MVRGLSAVLLVALLGGCYDLRSSDGGGMTAFEPPRRYDPADVAVPDGYRVELVAHGLTFPTAVTFDGRGGVHVVEAGYAYGEAFLTPRLLRIEPDGSAVEIARGDERFGPWTGVDWRDGAFYVTEGGEVGGGRITRIEPDGAQRVLVADLPSRGDHHTNGGVFGPDGWLYFSVGTATNSAVVGVDNWHFGWLKRFPDFHDTPCRDLRLAGVDYTSPDPAGGGAVTTGAFKPFGEASRPGEVVRGAIPCNGAVFRIRPEGGPIDLVAWGFRNPFGLAFSQEGELYVTENSYDRRGSRPLFGAGDLLWRVERGAWYGWPDFHGNVPVDAGDRFDPPDADRPVRVLAELPGEPPRPAARLAVHSSSNGFDFSRDPAFGHVGQAFVAQFGDQSPTVGKVWEPVGYRVVRVDPGTGTVQDFAVNRALPPGPASWTGGGGLERPVAARFDPEGRALYIVDFGVMTMSEEDGSQPRPGTGALWRVVREDRKVAGGAGEAAP